MSDIEAIKTRDALCDFEMAEVLRDDDLLAQAVWDRRDLLVALAEREAEIERLREYVRHTTDDHGYPCPEGITRKERAVGVRCICGLDAPRRNLNHTPAIAREHRDGGAA